MRSQVESVAQNHIGKWAHLDADISLFDFFNEIWEQGKLEPVANSLGVEHHRVVQVRNICVVGLSSVEETIHAVGGRGLVLLSGQDLGHELTDARSELLFVNHVEASDQLRIFSFTDTHVIQYLIDVGCTDNLQAGEDERQLKVWSSLLNLIDNFLD